MAAAVEDICCGSRRLNLVTAHLLLRELSGPLPPWTIARMPAGQQQTVALQWETEALSQHVMEFVRPCD